VIAMAAKQRWRTALLYIVAVTACVDAPVARHVCLMRYRVVALGQAA